MNTSISVNKVTFTQTRAHKYLSVRTQMVDIFLRSFLYGISLLQFLHDDKEMRCCSWHSGLGGPLCLPCWGEDCFVIETHIHMLYKWNTRWATRNIFWNIQFGYISMVLLLFFMNYLNDSNLLLALYFAKKCVRLKQTSLYVKMPGIKYLNMQKCKSHYKQHHIQTSYICLI